MKTASWNQKRQKKVVEIEVISACVRRLWQNVCVCVCVCVCVLVVGVGSLCLFLDRIWVGIVLMHTKVNEETPDFVLKSSVLRAFIHLIRWSCRLASSPNCVHLHQQGVISTAMAIYLLSLSWGGAGFGTRTLCLREAMGQCSNMMGEQCQPALHPHHLTSSPPS